MPPVVIERESKQLHRPSPALSSILIEIMINFHRGGVRGPAGSILDRVIVDGRGEMHSPAQIVLCMESSKLIPKQDQRRMGNRACCEKFSNTAPLTLSRIKFSRRGEQSPNVKSFVFMRPRRVTAGVLFLFSSMFQLFYPR